MAMKKITTNKNPLPGYPLYPDNEDIYQRDKEEENIDPENILKNKTPNEPNKMLNEKDFKDDKSGNDLDVPGAELDDEQENIGNEDEENNYYSLGDTEA
jgi:hypothetical protein